MLPLCMVTLNVPNRALTSTCGGGRLVNLTSQQNPRDMPLFLVSVWCMWCPLKLFWPIRETKERKTGSKSKTFTFEDAVSAAKCSNVPQIVMQMVSNTDHQCVSVWGGHVRQHPCVQVHICAYESPCTYLPFNTSPNHSGLIKDQFNYCDKVSVGSIMFMVIISMSVLSPVGLKSRPIDLAAPHLWNPGQDFIWPVVI